MADRSDSLKLYEDQPQEVTTTDILRRYGPEPDERGMLLPISRTGGKLSLDWPSAIYEPYQAIKRLVTRPVAPGYLSSSGDRGPIEDSFNAAAAVAAPSLGLNYAGMAPKNAVGIFGGRLAKTADQAALARAEEMAAKGADRRAIWDETGWFQGKDGKWRFEIDDSKSALNPYPNTPQQAYDEVAHRAFVDQHPFDVERRKAMEPLKGLTTDEVRAQWKERAAPIIEAAQRGDKEAAMRASDARQPWDWMLSEMGQRKYGPMGAYLEHPNLFESYPAIKELHTRVDPYLEARGQYYPGSRHQGEQIAIQEQPTFSQHKGTLLHELQHKIQADEGFARGERY